MGIAIAQEIRRLFVGRAAAPVDRAVAPAATPALQGLGLDHLTLSDAVVHAKETARSAKAAMLDQRITPDRAGAIATITDPDAFFNQLQFLSADQLRDLARLQPEVVGRFESYLGDRQAAWLGDINEVLRPSQVQAQGKHKAWNSMLGRLDKDTAKRLGQKDKRPATPSDLFDLTRARIDTERLEPSELRKLSSAIVEGLRSKHPDRIYDSQSFDTVGRSYLESEDAPYKGRINLRIFDVTDGVKHGAFELQIGPKQLTTFWETPFEVPGVQGQFNIHDAMYKGLGQIRTPEQFAAIARGISKRPLSKSEAAKLGQLYVEKTQASYKEQLSQAVTRARAGEPYDFQDSLILRTRIGTVIRSLQDARLTPAGLVSK